MGRVWLSVHVWLVLILWQRVVTEVIADDNHLLHRTQTQDTPFKSTPLGLGMMVHDFNPRTQKAGTGRSLSLESILVYIATSGQPVLPSETLPLNKKLSPGTFF